MTINGRRWDTDTRGRGIADGGWIAADVLGLLTALGATDWVAEDPDLHLLPHLRRACDEPGAPWTLQRTTFVDGVYIVTLDWARTPARLGRVRADVYTLLGVIAESVTYVHQRMTDAAIHFNIATGMLDGDSPFRAHGHLLRFEIGGPVVAALCAGARQTSRNADA